MRVKWNDLNVTVEEGIHVLLSITCITVQLGAVKYNSIPKKRELGSELIKAPRSNYPKCYSKPGNNHSQKKKLDWRTILDELFRLIFMKIPLNAVNAPFVESMLSFLKSD